jgi:hypothetical protein
MNDTETDKSPPTADPLTPNSQGLIPLEALCPLLGMKFEVARRKHSLGTLPVKAFRLNDTRRGPLFVHVDDLEKVIARRRVRGTPPMPQGSHFPQEP